MVAMGNLFEDLDNDRLLGRAPPLAASLARIEGVATLPHDGGEGCRRLGIVPTDYPKGLKPGSEIDPPPPDFNPRPLVSPGLSFAPNWLL